MEKSRERPGEAGWALRWSWVSTRWGCRGGVPRPPGHTLPGWGPTNRNSPTRLFPPGPHAGNFSSLVLKQSCSFFLPPPHPRKKLVSTRFQADSRKPWSVNLQLEAYFVSNQNLLSFLASVHGVDMGERSWRSEVGSSEDTPCSLPACL